jgi:hypothetical protein
MDSCQTMESHDSLSFQIIHFDRKSELIIYPAKNPYYLQLLVQNKIRMLFYYQHKMQKIFLIFSEKALVYP